MKEEACRKQIILEQRPIDNCQGLSLAYLLSVESAEGAAFDCERLDDVTASSDRAVIFQTAAVLVTTANAPSRCVERRCQTRSP